MKPIFLNRSFCTDFSSSFYVTSLSWKISFCLSVNHNPELQCVICTGVTLFTVNYTFCTGVLHCTALSQSESNNFFMYIISSGTESVQINESMCSPTSSPVGDPSSRACSGTEQTTVKATATITDVQGKSEIAATFDENAKLHNYCLCKSSGRWAISPTDTL